MRIQQYTNEELEFAEKLHRETPLSLYEILLDQRTRITELQKQLADAKKDAERLDYLNGKRYWLHSGDGYYESTVKFKWGDSVERRNLRQAIDAAIAEGKA